MKKGIDISVYQGAFNMKVAKDEGIEFVIAKCGGSDDDLYKDRYFEQNYINARLQGLDVGLYWFSKALNENDVERDVNFICDNCLKNKIFELPIFIDIENQTQLNIGKQELTNIINKYVELIKERTDIDVGVYSSLSYYKNYMYQESLNIDAKWVAQWESSKCDDDTADIWQYSSSEIVAGKRVDTNYILNDNILGYSSNAKINNIKIEELVKMELKVLRKGMKCNECHTAMVLMKDKGYYNGVLDDLFGDGMYEGALKMQKEHPELIADGIIGSRTWEYLLK